MLTPQTKVDMSPLVFKGDALIKLFLAFAFLAAVHLFVNASVLGDIVDPQGRTFLMIAAVVGGYMVGVS